MEILVLSNGKGEDSLAVTLLKAIDGVLKGRDLPAPGFKTIALVGSGEAYVKAGYRCLPGGKDLPSHGFAGLHVLSLMKDISAGLIGLTIKQIRTLKKYAKEADLIICVGDIYPVLLAAVFTDKPIIHLATAISVRFQKYNMLEISLFKKRCAAVFSRDRETADFLKERGVRAEFLGNVMMDDPILAEEGNDLGIPPDKKAIGLLPSSRQDAYSNIIRMLKIISNIGNQGRFEYLLSLSPSLDPEKLRQALASAHFRIVPNRAVSGEIGRIYGRTNVYVRIITGHFGDIVRRSTLVLGMTGTGNEQAAGLGTPLFLIQGGASASRKRIRQYLMLLNGAVEAGARDNVNMAKQIVALSNNKKKLEVMASAGRRIMGSAGASKKIAEEILRIAGL